MRYVLAVMMEIEARNIGEAVALAKGIAEVGSEGAAANIVESEAKLIAAHPPLEVPPSYLLAARDILRRQK